MTGQMGFKTDFSFDYVCILNDSWEISGQYNIIQTRMFFLNTNRTNRTNLFRLRHGIYSFDSGDSWST